MTARIDELAARRRALVAQSDALRETFALSAQGVKSTLSFFDMGFAAGRAFGRQPLLLVGLAAAVIAVRPRRIFRALSFALTSLSIYHRVRRAFAGRRVPLD